MDVSSRFPVSCVAGLTKRQSAKLRREVIKDVRKADKSAVDSALATALGWMADGGPRHEVERALNSIKQIHKTMPLGPERLQKLQALHNEITAKKAAPAQATNDRRVSVDSMASGMRYDYRDRLPRTSGRTKVDPKSTGELLDMFNDDGAFIKSTHIGIAGGWFACGLAQVGIATQTRPTGERRIALTAGAGLGMGIGAAVEVSRHKMADSKVRDHFPSGHFDWQDRSHVALGVGYIAQGSPMESYSTYHLKNREHGATVGCAAIFTLGRPFVTIPVAKISPSLSPIREALDIDLSQAQAMPEAILQQAMEEELAAATPQISEATIRLRPQAAFKSSFEAGTKRVRAKFKTLEQRLSFAPKPPAYAFPAAPTDLPAYVEEKKAANVYEVEV